MWNFGTSAVFFTECIQNNRFGENNSHSAHEEKIFIRLCSSAGTPEVSEPADIGGGRAASCEGDERGPEETQHPAGTGEDQGSGF